MLLVKGHQINIRGIKAWCLARAGRPCHLHLEDFTRGYMAVSHKIATNFH